MVLADTFGFSELQAEAAWKEGISLQPRSNTALERKGMEALKGERKGGRADRGSWFRPVK